MENNIIIRIEQSNEQVLGYTKKIVGLIRAKFLIPIIDNLNLEANPRSSKTGPVTDAIQDSIENNYELFPIKTKGILLASSQYEMMDRNRIMLHPVNPQIEGILDGGHNTLAVGLYILRKSFDNMNESFPRGAKTWNEFKRLWDENREYVDEYLETVRNSDTIPDNLNFFIPVELLVPTDPLDNFCVEAFKGDLLEICAARNNNVQLQASAKANQEGLFDDFRAIMNRRNPVICDRIEWKTNEGGDIPVQDLVALSWIPLNLVTPVRDDEGRVVEPTAPYKLYSSKGACLNQFVKFMSSPDVTREQTHDYKKEIINPEVLSAFEIAVQLPELYDYIYERLPKLYNAAGGLYGRISAVDNLNSKRKDKRTPFTNKKIETLSPEGYVTPLVYGLQALLTSKTVGNYTKITWKDGIDPFVFLEENLGKIVQKYATMFPLCDYDPQKIGKAAQSYQNVLDSFNMILAGIL